MPLNNEKTEFDLALEELSNTEMHNDCGKFPLNIYSMCLDCFTKMMSVVSDYDENGNFILEGIYAY